MAVRLTTSGRYILYLGKPFTPVGYNLVSAILSEDAAAIKARGGNFVRIVPTYFDNDNPPPFPVTQPNLDMYDPGQPGNLNPVIWDVVLAKIGTVVGANSVNDPQPIFVSIAINGGNKSAGFYDGYVLNAGWPPGTNVADFCDAWTYMATALKDMDYIGGYEILTEPDAPSIIDGQVVDGFAVVIAMYQQVAAAIRLVDPDTPVIIGPANHYEMRGLPAGYAQNLPNCIYTFDFYELQLYVEQTNTTPPPFSYTGYPAVYFDKAGNALAIYPYWEQGSHTAYMDKIFLGPDIDGGLIPQNQHLLGTAVRFSKNFNVPIYANQFGVASLTPSSYQYTIDCLTNFAQCDIPVGWSYWSYRHSFKAGTLLAGDVGINWQDAKGNWFVKDGVQNSVANGGDGLDWINLVSSFFPAPPQPPVPQQAIPILEYKPYRKRLGF